MLPPAPHERFRRRVFFFFKRFVGQGLYLLKIKSLSFLLLSVEAGRYPGGELPLSLEKVD